MTRSVGRPKNPPKARELLKSIIPTQDMFNEDELPIYEGLIDIYLKDFDEDDLTSSDIDDLMTLATNKILEIRLLKASKEDTGKHMDASSSIEKLRKQNEKIKDNLASRRKDRIDPHAFKGFSIVDIAVAFDNEKKQKLEKKSAKLRAEQVEFEEKLLDYGNKDDIEGRNV
jgi:hypothetical protein